MLRGEGSGIPAQGRDDEEKEKSEIPARIDAGHHSRQGRATSPT